MSLKQCIGCSSHVFMPCQEKTGKNSFRFKNNVTTFTTFSFSHFVNTGLCELFNAKVHMKINEENQMSFVKLKLSVILDRTQLEIL